MKTAFRRCAVAAVFAFVAVGLHATAQAQQQGPAIGFESLLDTPFHPSGVIAFDTLEVVFATPAPVKGRIDVVKAGGETVASFESLADYQLTEKVFGRMAFIGPAHAQLKEPGKYEVRVSINGKLATVLPFTAKLLGGGDAFSPGKTWSYEGPWSAWGYFTLREFKGTQVIDLVYWSGKEDLPAGKSRDALQAKLLRDGKVIAHSSGYKGHIANERYRRQQITLFLPHDAGKERNPTPLSVAELMAPGSHELLLERQSDGHVLRRFRFTTRDGRVVSHPRTALGYSPPTDYIAPRVVKKGANVYDFVGAEWLESK